MRSRTNQTLLMYNEITEEEDENEKLDQSHIADV